MQIIKAIPTNIITGFLGVGKTTAINYLLKSKPTNERWAVLINEFGEIGVDASLLGDNSTKNSQSGIFIKEVAGGCMCCTSGLPMQVALNCLLKEAQPHRLLIEPTGLGHPREVLETLVQDHYKNVLKIQATLSLVDARNLHDTRYTSNDTFNEQLAVADIIIGNKADLYDEADKSILKNYSQKFTMSQLFFVENAQLDWQWLLTKSKFTKPSTPVLHSPFIQNNTLDTSVENLPSCGYVIKENQQADFYSIGWRFSPTFVFSRLKISVFFMGLQVERVKGVFITDEGVFGYNKTAYGLTEIPLDESIDSRFEVINNDEVHNNKMQWHEALLDACL